MRDCTTKDHFDSLRMEMQRSNSLIRDDMMTTIELQARELERKETQIRILDDNLRSQSDDLAIEIN